MPGILLDCSKVLINRKNDNDVTIYWHDIIFNFFDVALFLLLTLVTGPSFMSISSLVLELWQFSFIRDWREIWKLKIPSSEFCPISGDWGKLQIPNLAQMSQLYMSQCYSFIVSELLRKNQHRGKITPPHRPHPD